MSRSSRPETVVVFDLDDTLYLERDFALSGFRAVGALFEAETGLPGLGERCAALFESGVRGRVFDRALEACAPGADRAWIGRLVEAYRAHEPAIALAPDAARHLAGRRPGARFGLVSDGPEATQRAKMRALGLDGAIDFAVLTGVWGRAYWKPHHRAFAAVEDWAGLEPRSLVYVADNPLKDFLAPRARGWRTVRIAREGRVHLAEAPDAAHEADVVITSLDDLEAQIEPLIEEAGRVELHREGRLRGDVLRGGASGDGHQPPDATPV